MIKTFKATKFNNIFFSVMSNLAHAFSEFPPVHYFTAENVASDHQHWDMLNYVW